MVSGAAFALCAASGANASITPTDQDQLDPLLLKRALRAFDRHRNSFAVRDVFGVVDFTAPSFTRRFHVVDAVSGQSRTLLVAHGRGSDPDHSGWVERFSNMPGSAASSSGAYLTGSGYSGKHGRSRRLIGLDPENSNAEARAIVIHPAWYVSPEMVRDHGKLGRSEGCLAVGADDIDYVLDRLGDGRMIYVDKIA